MEIGTPINISNNPGYDNQPSFTPDGKAVLFTSVRGNRKPNPANSAATGSDIYRYDIVTRRLSQVTNTPEAEYSPTVTPDRRHISVIRVEADGTQRLWQFAIDGKTNGRERRPTGARAARHQARRIPRVGERRQSLALFVLGQQGSLQRSRWRTRGPVRRRVAATGIGRSIQRIPRGGISFVSRAASTEGQPPTLTISELDPRTRQTRPLVRGASRCDRRRHGVDARWPAARAVSGAALRVAARRSRDEPGR